MSLEHKHSNIFIVGSGIAGSTLAMELLNRGMEVWLIDNQNPNSSSRVAAGLINPVVPKGVKKTWRYSEIFPYVFEYYRKWEIHFQSNFIKQIPFLQIHSSENEAKEWEKRSHDQDLDQLIKSAPVQSHQILQQNPSKLASIVENCGRLDVACFLACVQHEFETKNRLIQGQFDYQHIFFDGNRANSYTHNDQIYPLDKIIFCEGIGVLQNPWFNNLFFDPTGGDVLKVRIRNLPQTHIIKQIQWLVPTQEKNIFLIGSNFHKGDLSTHVDEKDALFFIHRAKEITNCEVELLEHKRGVRPTVQNRRPYLGRHSKIDNLYVYNGLGAKGSSLSSWLSPIMADFLLDRAELPDEVNIQKLI